MISKEDVTSDCKDKNHISSIPSDYMSKPKISEKSSVPFDILSFQYPSITRITLFSEYSMDFDPTCKEISRMELLLYYCYYNSIRRENVLVNLFERLLQTIWKFNK